MTTPEEVADFEQDLLSEFVLARASAGTGDGTVAGDVDVIVEVRSWFGRPLWEMEPRDLDRFFGQHQRDLAHGTKVRKAHSLSTFFEFLELRHKPAIHAATGHVVESPLDEINRPRGSALSRLRIPPPPGEIDHLFSAWRDEVPQARKPLPILRSYTAMRLASLIGPRVSELCLANVNDIHWELGQFGKILLRGKGRRGKKKERLVPLINGSRQLLEWWVDGPRWQYDDRVDEPGSRLFPSERRAADGSSLPVDTDTLRLHLKKMVAQHLPSQMGNLTPHTLRHFAASELYRQGVDVVAIQELLGHKWINTTMIYINPRELHQTGEKSQVTWSRRETEGFLSLYKLAA
ncbi:MULTISPECIES: site-specific integrase [unclassified Streptomyces]|uniref:tyrosine-type recombinase/integrase n=1 Tax=unclassified Streptomyces TaxID=2593676 RepID=UPI001EF24A9A|nr:MULTISPECIES: site-specific integrase [unclassified Streptomyces]